MKNTGLMFLGLANILGIVIIYYSRSSYLRSWLLLDIVKALKVTWKVMWSRKVTEDYPQSSTPRSLGFRGALALRRYENGEERCIACRLCEASCPAVAITIESKMDEGRRIAERFDIDAFKCIHCGLCEQACPVDAIVLTQKEHIVYTARGENILTKDILLGLGDIYAPATVEDEEVSV